MPLLTDKTRVKSLYVALLALSLYYAGPSSAQTSAAAIPPQSEADAKAVLLSQLRDVITSWASAWQSQLDEVYLLHYHPDFKPEGFKSLEAWKTFRRARVKDPNNISISLKEFEVVESTADTALVRFWLSYSRPGYADRTHKEMQMRLEGHIWMIAGERNLEVVKLGTP